MCDPAFTDRARRTVCRRHLFQKAFTRARAESLDSAGRVVAGVFAGGNVYVTGSVDGSHDFAGASGLAMTAPPSVICDLWLADFTR